MSKNKKLEALYHQLLLTDFPRVPKHKQLSQLVVDLSRKDAYLTQVTSSLMCGAKTTFSDIDYLLELKNDFNKLSNLDHDEVQIKELALIYLEQLEHLKNEVVKLSIK